MFDTIQLIPASSGFDHTSAQKDVAHFPNIQDETGFPYFEMLFFDDEHNNVLRVCLTTMHFRRITGKDSLAPPAVVAWTASRRDSGVGGHIVFQRLSARPSHTECWFKASLPRAMLVQSVPSTRNVGTKRPSHLSSWYSASLPMKMLEQGVPPTHHCGTTRPSQTQRWSPDGLSDPLSLVYTSVPSLHLLDEGSQSSEECN